MGLEVLVKKILVLSLKFGNRKRKKEKIVILLEGDIV